MPAPAIRAILPCLLLLTALGSLPPAVRAQQPPPPPVTVPQMAYSGTTMPLLSLDAVNFLNGTWTATSRDGRQSLGAYTFARQLNGTILSRTSDVDPACDAVKQPACARKDLFFVYQDSPGAPLKAISFDNEGHVLHYLATLAVEASTSDLAQRDIAIFDTDPAYLGDRFRLLYIHSVDKVTGKDSMSGAFEMLLPDGTFRDLKQWWGVRQ